MSSSFTTAAAILIAAATATYAQDILTEKQAAHSDAITCLAVSNNGSTVLTGGLDKRAYLWEAKTCSKLKILSHGGAVLAVAFNAGNSHFASGAADNRVVLFDAAEGKPLRMYREHTGPVNAVAFNPVNDNLASGSDDNSVKIWSPSAAASVNTLMGHEKPVKALAFSPDGKYLVSGGADNAIKLWDAAKGELIASADAGAKEVTSLAWSNDGTVFAAGGANGTVTLWDAKGTKVADLKGMKSAVTSVAFTPDGQYVAAAGKDKKIVIWNVAGKQVAKETDAHESGAGAIGFSGSGNIMATGGTDGTLKIWSTKSLNIGPRKYATGGGTPVLACSGLAVKDANNNGIIEASEAAGVEFTIKNTGDGLAFNVQVAVTTDQAVKGLSVNPKPVGNLAPGASKTVSIALTAGADLEAAAGTLTVTVTEANGHNPAPLNTGFQTGGGSVYSYIMVTEHSYSSATGKAETGAPITLKLKLKNASQGEAKDIKINYIFPPGVLAVNKRFEVVPSIPPGETKEISMEFYATKEFEKDEVKIAISLEGAYNNAGDLVFGVKMNQELPPTEMIAMNETPQIPEQPLFRGGNPLEGLNVAKAKEMVIGTYYALVVGIDSYKGEWAKLNNAVRDAKAVEALLNSKYKFDQFRTLYNEQATRANIIKEMEWLVANVKPNDNVFIYYSGHGDFKQALNKGYWVPFDASTASTSQYLSNSDLQTYLGGIRSKHTLLVSDACFSGDIFRGHTVSVPFAESEKYYREVHSLPSRQAITSGGIEPVMDGGRDGHSVFAYYFLKTLRENTARYFDAGQLYTKIKIPVINNSEQSPKLSPIKNTGDEGGQFIFITK